jgi:hypothetical protein
VADVQSELSLTQSKESKNMENQTS